MYFLPQDALKNFQCGKKVFLKMLVRESDEAECRRLPSVSGVRSEIQSQPKQVEFVQLKTANEKAFTFDVGNQSSSFFSLVEEKFAQSRVRL